MLTGAARRELALAVLLTLAPVAVTGLAPAAQADVFNPAYFQLIEQHDNTFSVTWRVPTNGTARLAVNVVFPEGVEELTPRRSIRAGNYAIESWTVRADASLEGKRVQFSGILGGATDVIARLEFLDGTQQVARLSPDADGFTVTPPAGALDVAGTYFVLGMEHILIGIDHLLFVLALLLIVRGWRRLIATITAFTVAHSITLAAAALGVLRVPIAPVEAIIALSIVFVAAEALHGAAGRHGITARAPWIVAFSFGLLHGLGFASALSEIGLPEHAIPLALLMFNVGVEAGQLVFVAAVLLLAVGASRLHLPGSTFLVNRALPYAIGSIAAFWTLERVLGGVLGFESLA